MLLCDCPIDLLCREHTFNLHHNLERESGYFFTCGEAKQVKMDHKITVGGGKDRCWFYLLGKFCEMRWRIGVFVSFWTFLGIVIKFEVKSATLLFMAHIYYPCCDRSIGPLPSCWMQFGAMMGQLLLVILFTCTGLPAFSVSAGTLKNCFLLCNCIQLP